MPGLASGNGRPDIANKFFWVIGRIDDPVVLADQLLAGVFRYFAKLVVDERYYTALVGERNNGGFVEREL